MNDQHKPFDIAEFARDLMVAQAQTLHTGMNIAEEKFYARIRGLEAAYMKASLDPETKIPSYLMAVIISLIGTLPERYADAMNAREQRERHEGKPEHDMSTGGMPLKAGS